MDYPPAQDMVIATLIAFWPIWLIIGIFVIMRFAFAIYEDSEDAKEEKKEEEFLKQHPHKITQFKRTKYVK